MMTTIQQAKPDGKSPNGKRPRPAEALEQQARAPLSQAELESAVSEMKPLVQSTADAVHWNCDLLNALIGRVNALEAWTKIAEPEIAKSTKVA